MISMFKKYNSVSFKIILLIIVCFVFYSNTIFNNYALDDGLVISDNHYVQNGIYGLKDIFFHDSFAGCLGDDVNLVSGGRYRPLSLFTFALEYQIFGLNPHISHLINIVLLAALVIILFTLINKLFRNYFNKDDLLKFSFIACLLFISHPVHTEVVSNIKSRDEILALIGSLASIYFIIKFIETDDYWNLVNCFFCFFIALLSKENSITFIAIIPLSVYFLGEKNLKKYFLSMIPLFIACFLFLIIRYYILGNNPDVQDELLNNPFIHASFSEKYATILYTLGVYIKLLFFPHPLTFDYYPFHISILNWHNILPYISFFLHLALLAFSILNLKKKSILSFGILYYFITLSIVSNIFFPVGTFMSERFLFMPSVGFVLIIAWIIVNELPALLKSKSLRIVLFVLIMLACFVKTYSRNLVWKDNYTLFTTDVKTSSNSIKGNLTAGNVLYSKAFSCEDSVINKMYYRQALIYAKKAVSLYPDYADGNFLLANTLLELGQNDSAVFYYERVIELMPDKEKLVIENIDNLLTKNGEISSKFIVYSAMLKISPDNFLLNYYLGYLNFLNRKDYNQSILYFTKAISIAPGDYNANKYFGYTYYLLNDFSKSKYFLTNANAINSSDIEVQNKLDSIKVFLKQ